MFEFAIAQNQKRRPSRWAVYAYFLSCAAHLATLALLIEFPEILRPGTGRWLSHLLNLEWRVRPASARAEPGWRTVAVVGSGGGSSTMTAPSAETLRKYAYDWSRGSGTGKQPPVRIQLDKEVLAGNTRQEVPRVTPTLGASEPKPVRGEATEARQVQPPAPATVGSQTVTASGGPVAVVAGASASAAGPKIGERTVFLPAPSPEPAAPRKIPSRIEPTAAEGRPASPETAGSTTPGSAPQPPSGARRTQTASAQEPKVFADKQSAIQTEGTGFFDTKGFPLGDYAHAIIERVKGNWSIPSNLRNSQGRSTVIFYIDKNGRVIDARIVTSSGSSSLDLAALSSVLGSNPFPPLPRGFPGEQVGAKFVFAYNERH